MHALKPRHVSSQSTIALTLPLILAAAAVVHADTPLSASASAALPGAVIQVANCNDNGPGSLRAAVAAAVSGDTINLQSLDCPRIILTSGAILIGQDDLTLLGPGRAFLVDGNHASAVFEHSGSGTLRIRRMSIAYGYHGGLDVASVRGGCIDSLGDLRLEHVRVHHCLAEARASLEPDASGGGIAAAGNVVLYDSAVLANSLASTHMSGGGIFAGGRLTLVRSHACNNISPLGDDGGARANGGLFAYHSEISGNQAGSVGGIFAGGGDITIAHSTISGNQAVVGHGGAELHGTIEQTRILVVNSTISGNLAQHDSGLDVVTGPNVDTSITNSTIAFNRESPSVGAECQGALGLNGLLHLDSTIIARNTCDSVPVDIGGTNFGQEIIGANNLIGTSTLPVPADTISADPRLAALADNGGRTRTHALMADSPAIDTGNNAAGLRFDQRGPGFPRVKGTCTDIGAFER